MNACTYALELCIVSRRDCAFGCGILGCHLGVKLLKVMDRYKWFGLVLMAAGHMPFLFYLEHLYWVESQAVLRSLCAFLAGLLFFIDAQRSNEKKSDVRSNYWLWLGLSGFFVFGAIFGHPVCWAFSFAFLVRALFWRFDRSFWLVPLLLGFFVCPWDYILGPLIDVKLCEVTAYVSEFVVARAGLNTLIRPEALQTIEGEGFRLSVTSACAGVQTFVALQTLSLVLSFVLYAKRIDRILRFLLLVFLSGFIGNTLRIILSCYCAYWFSNNIDYWNIVHDSLGVLTYIFVILFAIVIEKHWTYILSRTRQGAL